MLLLYLVTQECMQDVNYECSVIKTHLNDTSENQKPDDKIIIRGKIWVTNFIPPRKVHSKMYPFCLRVKESG